MSDNLSTETTQPRFRWKRTLKGGGCLFFAVIAFAIGQGTGTIADTANIIGLIMLILAFKS